MKYFIAVSALVALALCAPYEEAIVNVSQDTAGNYKYSFESTNFTKTEEGRDGSVTGSFTYLDDSGVRQTVNYKADEEGFIASGSNFPVPVIDTEDVAKARSDFLTTYEEVLKTLPITDEFTQGEGKAPEMLGGSVVGVVKKGGLVPVVKYVPYEIPITK